MIPLWVYLIGFGPIVVTGIAGTISIWKIEHTDWYPGSGRFDNE